MPMIEFATWNLEWMNDWFTDGPSFHPDDRRVRGPNPGSRDNPTLLERRQSVAGAIDEMGLDVIVVVEGPNKADELQLFFDTDVAGDWICDVQPTKGASQIVGIAVRTDTGKFANPPLTRFHVGEGQGGEAERISSATTPFLLDTDGDGIDEYHKFERLPLYAQVNIADGTRFRVLGLHLKSKGVFDTLEWAKWWATADGNRKKIVAQCRQLRKEFLDHYLAEDATRDVALVVCGDVNDGPGMDASEQRLNTSGVERLMGTVWKPKLTLGNALYDALDDEDRHEIAIDDISTSSFRDPLIDSYRKVWLDHVLYSNNKAEQWLGEGKVFREFAGANPGETEMIWRKYPHASDHHPVFARIDSAKL